VRRKPQRTGSVFMFPLRKLLYCIEQLAYCYTNLPMNTASFTASTEGLLRSTAFAACLEISANLRMPGELTNPPVEGRPQ